MNLNFNILKVEYHFRTNKLINETPLSIGSGKTAIDYSDNPVVKLGMEDPFIPASSIKGVLRSEAERYIRSVYGDRLKICNIFNNEEELNLKNNVKNGEEYRPCIMCSIFGGPTIASRVYIDNAILTDKSRSAKVIERIRKVSINRVTGAQYSGRLYDIEYLVPNLEFTWGMRFYNIDILDDSSEENKTVNEIIDYLLKRLMSIGLVIGGRKSIGFGKIKVDPAAFTLYKYTLKEGKLEYEDVTNDYKKRLGL